MTTITETYAAFSAALNAHDLDRILALYEPNAAFSGEPGQVVHGMGGLTGAMLGFLALKPRMKLDLVYVVETGDIALTRGTWSLQGVGEDGAPVELSGKSLEVLRRQADGTWRFVVDCPNGAA